MFRFIILRVLGGLLQARNQKLFRAGKFSVFLELGNFNKQPPKSMWKNGPTRKMAPVFSLWNSLTLFRMGRGEGVFLPNQFFSGTSANIGICPKNFLTFSFNPFAPLV